LEASQKGSITNTKVLGHDEEIEVGPNGKLRRRKYKFRNHKTLKVE
jgi:hypothetical protein